MICGNSEVGGCFFFLLSYGHLQILEADLHSYPHGPYGLLNFGIGVLLLEADLAITTLVKELYTHGL